MRMLREHFWRAYAKELMHPTIGRLGNAVESAAHVTAIPAVAVASGLLLALLALAGSVFPSAAESLRRYEELGIAAFVSVAVVTYVAVRRYVLRSCQIEPRDALERYGHRRDRILLAIQFWSALLIFAAVPFTLLALNRTHS